MSKLDQARYDLRSLCHKVLDVTDNPKLDASRKLAELKKLDPQVEAARAEVESLESVAAKHKAWAGAGVFLDELGGTSPSVSSFGAGPRLGAAPSLTPSEDQLRGLHEALLSHKSFRIEVDTKGPSADVPSSLMPGIVGRLHEPTRILDLIPSAPMTTPSVEYLRHVSTTGTAGMVAPGALKPAVVLTTDKLEARARKIAVTTKVNDEDLEDFGGFVSYISTELQRLVVDQENIQLLTGDGTGENLQGIFSVTGILTRVKAVAPETGIDTLELAATDLRNGPAYVDATVFAMHPTTWSGLRLLKDGQGRYILGNPAEQDAAKLWGVPVVKSTGITVGTVLAADLPAAGQAHIRKGLVIQSDYGTDGFERNTTSLRCEERIALAVARPAAAIKVTGL
jgi:HK97 family phage major capsid protein